MANKTDNPAATNELSPAIALVRVPKHQPEKELNDSPTKKNKQRRGDRQILFRVVVSWSSKRNKSIVDSIVEMTAHMADLAIEVVHG